MKQVRSLLCGRTMMATATIDHSPKPGDVLAGKYVLEQRLGAGGMGVVFLARHRTLARRVAIKILHHHLACQARFARLLENEAIAASRVQHRGAVKVFDFATAAGGTPFIAMELVAGRPLGHILHEEVIALPRALGIIDQILEVLGAAHASAVVHADVKSDNFLVEQQARGDRVTLIDFGLAHLDGATPEQGFAAGTPRYIAPELLRGGALTPACDLYGAGVILYELLTGTTPFGGDSMWEILKRQLGDEVIPPSVRRPDRAIPEDLDWIVVRALAKDPCARYASAQDFRDALGAVSLQRDRRTPRPPPLPSPCHAFVPLAA